MSAYHFGGNQGLGAACADFTAAGPIRAETPARFRLRGRCKASPALSRLFEIGLPPMLLGGGEIDLSETAARRRAS
jgi:hypothetical protein